MASLVGGSYIGAAQTTGDTTSYPPPISFLSSPPRPAPPPKDLERRHETPFLLSNIKTTSFLLFCSGAGTGALRQRNGRS